MASKEDDQKLIQQLTDAMETCLMQDRLDGFEEAQIKRMDRVKAYFKNYSEQLTPKDRDFFDKIFEYDRNFEKILKSKKQEYFESSKVQKRLKDGLTAYKLSSLGK